MTDDLRKRLGALRLSLEDAVDDMDRLTHDYPELSKFCGLAHTARQMRQYFEDNIAARIQDFIRAYDEVNNARD